MPQLPPCFAFAAIFISSRLLSGHFRHYARLPLPLPSWLADIADAIAAFATITPPLFMMAGFRHFHCFLSMLLPHIIADGHSIEPLPLSFIFRCHFHYADYCQIR
jgi:hypothetical protein